MNQKQNTEHTSSLVPMTCQFTLIDAEKPSILSKTFFLDEKGELRKKTGGQLVFGRATHLSMDFHIFGEKVLTHLKPHQALVFGVSGHATANIIPQAKLNTLSPNGSLPSIARTNKYFHWPEGVGILMLDYDPQPKQPSFSPDDLFEALYRTCPQLKQAPTIWKASASSFIYKKNGDPLRKLEGQRVYILVQDAHDIERAGKVLFARLWLAGFGWYEIGKAGQFLKRTIIDRSVFQPSRLDFAGGAYCEQGLEQKMPSPALFNEHRKPLDTLSALPDLSLQELSELKSIQDEAKKKLKPRAEKAKKEWIEIRSDEIEKEIAKKGEHIEKEELKQELRGTLEDGNLYSHFILDLQKMGKVSIEEILSDRDRFDGAYCKDPLEPDYNQGSWCAWLKLKNPAEPTLYSHAHGGRWYQLKRAIMKIKLKGGQLHRIVDQSMDVLQEDRHLYEREGVLVRIGMQSSNIHEVTPDWLKLYLNRLIRFEKWNVREKAMVPVDCPSPVARSICALTGDWTFSKLKALINAPLMTLTGRLIEHTGYDEETNLLAYLDESEWKNIPDKPSKDEVKEAFQTLYFPFEKFPFVDDISRSVLISSLLTAVQRPLLPTAPAFAFDAPVAGSGKTLLAQSVSALAGEKYPELFPPLKGNDDEVRKRLFASAYRGDRVIVFDNMVGQIDSPSLCAYLTAPQFSDRVLGQSKLGSAPVTALCLITGNNLQPVGDLNRRVLKCRIDPEMEKPYTRRFSLSPFHHTQRHRTRMIRAALLLMKARQDKGFHTEDSVASYEEWNEQIRATVLWLATIEPDFRLDDPLKSIDESMDQDPETTKLGSLLSAWHAIFGHTSTTVAQVLKQANQHEELSHTLNEIAGERESINPRRLGRWIEKFQGRIVNGLRLVRNGTKKGRALWVCQKV